MRESVFSRRQVRGPGTARVRHLLHAGVLRARNVRSVGCAPHDAEPARPDARRPAPVSGRPPQSARSARRDATRQRDPPMVSLGPRLRRDVRLCAADDRPGDVSPLGAEVRGVRVNACSTSERRIEFQHVWKSFRRGEVYDSVRDLVPAFVSRLLSPRAGRANQEFWAVEDVSFSVRPGETLGIIGANGAGKSTILKLLTGILWPTRGRCGIRGRVGALVEVTAGFHPDLTGAENIFLQGSIMGMARPEINASFDDIVAFSDLQEFIDTPVKRYSSGMSARLGFAIAAHMNPDVLIIDEVLSVGDHRFQQRAFNRVSELAREGRPVVMVSHQLDRIASLCTHCLLLNRGRVVRDGSPDDCISDYLVGVNGAG